MSKEADRAISHAETRKALLRKIKNLAEVILFIEENGLYDSMKGKLKQFELDSSIKLYYEEYLDE